MKNIKRKLPMYAIYDRTNIEKMLEDEAQKGWMLESLGNYIWKFKRIEPRKLHFAVTYFPKATFYDPEPSEQQKTLQDFCQHAGWTLVGGIGPMQVFCNERENPLPIETDPLVELENIHATAKKTYLSSFWLLLAVWILNLGMQISNIIRNPLDFLGSNLSLFNFSNAVLLVIMCLVELLGYYCWHRRAEQAARESGRFMQTRNYKRLELAILFVMLIGLILLLFTMDSELSTLMAVMLAGLVCVVLIGQGLIRLMKRLRVSAGTNKNVSMIVVVALTLVVIYVPNIYFVYEKPVPEEDVQTYEYRGSTIPIYQDPMPLTVEELMDPGYDRYSYKLETENSLFLTTLKARQLSRMGETAVDLSYEIYDIHLPQLYGICLDDILHSYDRFNDFDDAGNITNDSFQPVEHGPWGADAAYCRYSGGASTNKYLLCYGYRIIEITFGWEPTQDQMAIVGRELGKGNEQIFGNIENN